MAKIKQKINKKIAIVEDDENNQKLIKYVAQKAEFEVEFFSNNEHFNDLLFCIVSEKCSHRLIICDLNIPDNVTEVVKNFRKFKKVNEIAIIGVSADILSSGDWVSNGFNDMLAKPFNLKHLEDKIRLWAKIMWG